MKNPSDINVYVKALCPLGIHFDAHFLLKVTPEYHATNVEGRLSISDQTQGHCQGTISGRISDLQKTVDAKTDQVALDR